MPGQREKCVCASSERGCDILLSSVGERERLPGRAVVWLQALTRGSFGCCCVCRRKVGEDTFRIFN